MTRSAGRVYLIRNTLNGKGYVGQTTKTLEHRWTGHLKKSSTCVALRRAIQKHGTKNFSVTHLAWAENKVDLDTLEVEWIETLGTRVPNGYNIMYGGQGGRMPPLAQAKANQTHRTTLAKRASRGRAKGPSPLFEVDVRDIFHSFDKGETQKSISERYRVDPSTITHILAGDTWSHLGLRVTKKRFLNVVLASAKAIHKRHQEGVLVRDLVTEFKHTKATINRVLRGSTFPDLYREIHKSEPPDRRQPQGFRISDASVKKMQVLRQKGWSYPKISKALGVSTTSVHRRLKLV